MRCPDCSSSKSFHNGIEVVCQNCGLVIEENDIVLDQFSFDQNKTLEVPQLAHAGGQQVSGKIYKKSWLQSRSERNLNYVERELDLILPKLNLPHSLKKDCLILFKRINSGKFLKGRNLNATYVACLYYCMKQRNMFRTIELISLITGISSRMINQYLQKIIQTFQLKEPEITMEHAVEYFGNQLKFPPIVHYKALEIYEKNKSKLAHCKLTTNALVCLYVAHKEEGYNVPQRYFCNMTKIHEQTLRNRVKLIRA